MRRIDAENGDIQVILSSRPKGYSGEFDVFEPITWELNELERPDFDEYCDRWLKNRIKDTEERSDAQERINRGMMAESVQRLARYKIQCFINQDKTQLICLILAFQIEMKFDFFILQL